MPSSQCIFSFVKTERLDEDEGKGGRVRIKSLSGSYRGHLSPFSVEENLEGASLGQQEWRHEKAGPVGDPQVILYESQFQFSGSVVSDSLRPHESQHARPPCPSPTPRVYCVSLASSN